MIRVITKTFRGPEWAGTEVTERRANPPPGSCSPYT